MLRILRLLVAALLGCFVCDAQSSGSVPTTSTRIIGGTETRITSYPYLVSIEYYANFLSGWQHDCGGSILSQSVILTAAHCVRGSSRTTRNLRIRAGSSTRGSGGQIRRLRQISIHPKYNEDTDDYDVAVLLLTAPLNYNDEVKAISIQRSGTAARAGELVSIAGWGVTNTATNSVPTRLMHTSLSVVSRQTCATRYRRIAQITTRMVCALTPNRDSCQGDSGGPMVNGNGAQIGVVSFGVGCARAGYPGVYADLSNAEINSFIRGYLTSQSSGATTTATTARPGAVRPSQTRATTPRPRTSTRRPATARPSSSNATNLGTGLSRWDPCKFSLLSTFCKNMRAALSRRRGPSNCH